MKLKLQGSLKKYKSIPVPARAGMWFVICTMFQKCIGFVTVPIFTRMMPTGEYGLYSTYLSWYSILTVFCTLNMHSVVYINNYTKADSQMEKDTVPIPLLSLSEVLTIVLFITYVIFHRYLDPFIGLPFVLTCLLFVQILFLPPVNFWNMQQRFEYKYIILVVRTILMVLLNAGLGIGFVWLASSNQAIARVCSIVFVQVIFGGMFYVYFWKRGKQVFSTKGWKHALDVLLPLLPHNLSLTVLSSSDRIMILNMVGAAQAGIYSVAYTAGYVVNILKCSMVDALIPWLYQKIKEKDYQSIRKTLNIFMILIAIINIIFITFAPEVIYVMAPSQYYEAIYVIPPVAASSYFTLLYNIFSVIGMYYEKTKKIMVASVVGAAINLLLNFICIPVFGYIAAAYTTLACYIIFAFLHYVIMRSICKTNLNNAKIYDIKFILLMSVLMIVITIVFTFTYKHILIRYSIIFVMVAAVFIKRELFITTIKELKKSKKKKKG